MERRHLLLGVLALMTGSVPVAADAVSEQIAGKLGVRYEVTDNGLTHECPPIFKDGTCFRVKLTLSSPIDIGGSDWAIYFSNVEPLKETESDTFSVSHINGDLYRLVPKAGFTGFTGGVPYEATLWGVGSVLSHYYAMPNYYVADSEGAASVIESTVPVIDTETGLEMLPHVVPFADMTRLHRRSPDDKTPPATAAWLYERYGDTEGAEPSLLIPTPESVTETGTGWLDLTSGVTFHLEGVAEADVAAGRVLLERAGVKAAHTGVPVTVVRTAAENRAQGSYSLTISGDGIRVDAADGEGAQNALVSLAGLVTPGEHRVPLLTIEDAPRFAFRGVHLDLARNFNSKSFILVLLDQMATYKLNKLTLQLSDDEGWRIEVPGLPELTDIGSKRCHDAAEDRCLLPQLGAGPDGEGVSDGYLSVADYVEIIEAAKARHIEVIPFFDMPGHARAAIVAMEARYRRLIAEGDTARAVAYRLRDGEDRTAYKSIQHYNDNTVNVCLPSTYAFVSKLVDEVAAMHAQAGQPLRTFHLGADETPGAWHASPACARFLESRPDLEEEGLAGYFIETVSTMIAAKGITPAGWGDGLADTAPERMPPSVKAFAWAPVFWGGADNAHKLANNGWDLIVSTPDALYLDAPYSADPAERGYNWASRHTDTRKVFSFMPENLPSHAEHWTDSSGQAPDIADDVPLKPGVGFAGLQAQLWSETVRTDAQAAYMLFPRLLAVAERAWHRAPWELSYVPGRTYGRGTAHFREADARKRAEDWARFALRLGTRELPRLEASSIQYRIPPVGAVIRDGKLWCRLPFPGLMAEYRTGDGIWQACEPGVAVSGAVEVRARANDGARVGRSLIVTP